jgi:hypothetical protein
MPWYSVAGFVQSRDNFSHRRNRESLQRRGDLNALAPSLVLPTAMLPHSAVINPLIFSSVPDPTPDTGTAWQLGNRPDAKELISQPRNCYSVFL